jgi:hypothetical protein
MRHLILFFGLIILVLSCKNERKKVRIERFVWVRHNQNWIWDPKDLEARVYLEFLDSSNKIRLSKTNTRLKTSQYYINKAPDSLSELIIKNLYLKKIQNCYTYVGNSPYIYDGDYYCIIFKFENSEEQMFNYDPNLISDSLRGFTDYIERLSRSKSFAKIDSFDRTSLIQKYRDIILSCGGLAPGPPPLKEKTKFKAPVQKY